MYMCGSGSTKLLTTDPIRIRVHHTGTNKTELAPTPHHAISECVAKRPGKAIVLGQFNPVTIPPRSTACQYIVYCNLGLNFACVMSLGEKVATRAVNLHSLFADPDPAAVFLNADPNPAGCSGV